LSVSVLGYALLSLLVRRPRSGYDLARAMRRPIGFFWHARHSQIYPELARLEAQGMVTSQVIEQVDRPDKKLYTITEAGRTALRQWVTEPAELPPERSEILLKAYSVWLAEPEKALTLYRTHEQLHQAQLARYEQIMAEYEQEPDISSPFFGDYATLQRGIGYERGYVAWCRWMVEQLEKRLKRGQDGEP
jgi:PadR family transcriptional regulator AphA